MAHCIVVLVCNSLPNGQHGQGWATTGEFKNSEWQATRSLAMFVRCSLLSLGAELGMVGRVIKSCRRLRRPGACAVVDEAQLSTWHHEHLQHK